MKKKKGEILYHLSHKEIKIQDRESLFRSQCNDEAWWTIVADGMLLLFYQNALQPLKPEAPLRTHGPYPSWQPWRIKCHQDRAPVAPYRIFGLH